MHGGFVNDIAYSRLKIVHYSVILIIRHVLAAEEEHMHYISTYEPIP